MQLTVKIHGGRLLSLEVHPELEVVGLKALVEDESGLAIDEQRIMHKGRALRDADSLQLAGVNEGAQLYVAQHSGTSVDIDASAMVPQPGDAAAAAANDPMASMLNSPMMQGMLDNPEVLRAMLHSNPQMQELMENNPELAHVLNDPALLRQSLASARNPQLMREMQRNTDRAMSNIEAHPGGHNLLRRMYQTVQAPLEQATTMGPDGGAGGLFGQQQQQQQQQPSSESPDRPNTTALPNPWAAPQQQQQFGPFGGRGGRGFGFGFGGRGMGGGWPGRGGGGM